MILIIVFAVLTIINIALFIWCEYVVRDYEGLAVFGFAMSVVFGVSVFVTGLIAITVNSDLMVERCRIKNDEKVKSIIFRLENYTLYDMQELIEDTRKYNTDVLSEQRCLESKWIGWFSCPAYKEFKTIAIRNIFASVISFCQSFSKMV